MARILHAAACIAFLALSAAAQIKTAPVSGMYSSVPLAWANAFHSLATQPGADPFDVAGNPPLFIVFNFNIANPVLRASLAPVVMNLEAQGVTPETVSLKDLKPAVARAKVMAAAQAQALIQQAASAKTGQDDLPGVAAKLNLLQGTLGIYLPVEMQKAIKPAYEQAHSRLNAAQRDKVDLLLRRIAAGLENMSAVEALAAEGGVREGAVNMDSFARRHAQLAKAKPQALHTAMTPEIVGNEWRPPKNFQEAEEIMASLSQPKKTYVQKTINFGLIWDSYNAREWRVKAVAGDTRLDNPNAIAYMGKHSFMLSTRVLAKPAMIMDGAKLQALQDELSKINSFGAKPADLAAKMAQHLEDIKRQGTVPMVLYQRPFDTVFGDIPLSPVHLGALDDLKAAILHLGLEAPSSSRFLDAVEGLMARLKKINQWDSDYPDKLRRILADAQNGPPIRPTGSIKPDL